MIRAGVAVRDITPPAGLAMSGFAARTDPATGAHDALTVRALAVGDTVLVTADLLGLDAATAARIRAAVPGACVLVHATHTHGGPPTMPGRLGAEPDAAYLAAVEAALVEAARAALAARQPAGLLFGAGADPDVARNRRHADGPVDRTLPVLTVRGEDGAPLAVLVNYACHPVVLGADNLLWTADYPHFVRAAVERALPGATALFLTGCVGDLNTGHSAAASLSLAPKAERSFAEAERIGERIAAAALAAPLAPLSARVTAREAEVVLGFRRRETQPPEALAAAWEAEAQTADPVRRTLLAVWADWARRIAAAPLVPLTARVTLLDWGGLRLIGLPGEIFAETALDLRDALPGLMLAGFAGDNPGYIPPLREYPYGGYEVEEAHRYYGLPATFAEGSAEALRDAALTLARRGEH